MDENGFNASEIFTEDGKFTPDWRDKVFAGDENKSIRENLTLANIKDLPTMAKQVISGESTIGKLTGGRQFAILPNEHSTPEEIDAFHTKLGRPKTPQEYGFGQLPGANPKFTEKMSTALHAAGASKRVAEAAAKAYMEFSDEFNKAQETEAKIADAKGDKAIRDKFGSTYDAEMAAANLAITAIAAPIDAEYAKQLAEDVKYDLNAAQFLAKVGNLIAEDPGLKNATGTPGFSPQDAIAKANEIMANNPYYITDKPKDKPYNRQAHLDAIKEVQSLFEMAYPSKK